MNFKTIYEQLQLISASADVLRDDKQMDASQRMLVLFALSKGTEAISQIAAETERILKTTETKLAIITGIANRGFVECGEKQSDSPNTMFFNAIKTHAENELKAIGDFLKSNDKEDI